MSAYRAEVATAAQRDLVRLAPPVRARVIARLRLLAHDPRGGVLELRGAALYRVRVGDYRAIFDVRDDQRVVRIIRVRHRRESYRRL